MSRTFRRLTAVLILALLAGAGAVQALPVAKAKGPDGPRFEDPLLKVWTWIVAVVEKHSTFIDPNGGIWLTPDPEEPVESGDGATAGVNP